MRRTLEGTDIALLGEMRFVRLVAVPVLTTRFIQKIHDMDVTYVPPPTSARPMLRLLNVFCPKFVLGLNPKPLLASLIFIYTRLIIVSIQFGEHPVW